MSLSIDIQSYISQVGRASTGIWRGEVTEVTGMLIESKGPAVAIGDFCEIQTLDGRRIRTQVIGFRERRILSMPLEETDGLQPGDHIVARSEDSRVAVGTALLGRVLDGFGQPMDSGPAIATETSYDLYRPAPSPLDREHITEPLVTGIRAIDSMLPCGKGQRVGLFGGSGVGKSTLLGAICKHNTADVTVIALIGERNREVRAFLERELGQEGMKRAVTVVATSDRPAPLRVRAAFVALAIAEYFRDRGANVLLMMDSVTRLAMAQREIGLAAGEPPSQKGYTPSVFHMLPKVFERAGNFPAGSITGFFTVLVEGDDFNEPVCDAVRGLLDGHIVLSRQLGAAGHYPAIDILNSLSRLQSAISTPQQNDNARRLRDALSTYKDSEDLIQLGAYVAGANPKLDRCIGTRSEILDFLRQDAGVPSSRDETLNQLSQLSQALG